MFRSNTRAVLSILIFIALVSTCAYLETPTNKREIPHDSSMEHSI